MDIVTLALVIFSLLLGYVLKSLAKNFQRTCPFCAEIIKQKAIVCRFCGKDLMG
ncbi:MAG: hypothetical protein ACR2GD_10580 [Pyrinomonadaceae bacterium]